MKKKPALTRHRLLLAKLKEMAERGINGEKENAKRKLKNLKRRFDFGARNPDEAKDIFAGIFYKSTAAIPILKLADFETLNAIKWAIEQTTGIVCIFKHDELLASATPGSAKSLATIAKTVANNYETLWTKFVGETHNPAEKKFFIMGLFDGMMNDTRAVGQRLPSLPEPKRKRRTKRNLGTPAPAISVHPYSVAIKLGRQIRFATPIDELENELADTIRKQIA